MQRKTGPPTSLAASTVPLHPLLDHVPNANPVIHRTQRSHAQRDPRAGRFRRDGEGGAKRSRSLTVSVVDAGGVEDAGVGGSVADLHLHGEPHHAYHGQQQRLGEGRRRRLGRRGRRRRLRLPGAGHGGGGGKGRRRADPKKARGKDQGGRDRVTRFGGGTAPQVVAPFVFLSG